MSVLTRENYICPILGNFNQKFSENVLPTVKDVLCFLKLNELKFKLKNENPTHIQKQCREIVRSKLLEIWVKSSIPTVSEKQVGDLIRLAQERKLKLLKTKLTDREKPNFLKNLGEFQLGISKLFDIAACKCKDFQSCRCESAKKVNDLAKCLFCNNILTFSFRYQKLNKIF